MIAIDHPDEKHGLNLLMAAMGTTDIDFFNGLINQLIDASKSNGKPNQDSANFMLAVVKGIEPRDQTEAMLAAQMAAVHMQSMKLVELLNRVENIPQQDSASNAFNKLVRTFATQAEALKRYRTGGEQKVTVEHDTVNEGGQAIVGNVTLGGRGNGKKRH
jgi:hypothetical protein